MANAAQTECGTLGEMGKSRVDPANNLSELGSLVRHWPDVAKQRILTAFVTNEGVGVRTAKSLGISYGGLNKIIAKLAIGTEIDLACRVAGFPRHEGPERKTGIERVVPRPRVARKLAPELAESTVRRLKASQADLTERLTAIDRSIARTEPGTLFAKRLADQRADTAALLSRVDLALSESTLRAALAGDERRPAAEPEARPRRATKRTKKPRE